MPSPITIKPPVAAVVPAPIRVFPKLNSLIGMPNPTITTPTTTAMAPPPYNKPDIRVTPSTKQRVRRLVCDYQLNYSNDSEFWLFLALTTTDNDKIARNTLKLH